MNININLNLTEVPLNEALERVEKEVYGYAIQSAKFNQSQGAKLLGVSRGTFRTKLMQYFPGVYI